MSDASATADRAISQLSTPQGRDTAAHDAKSAAASAGDKAKTQAEDAGDKAQSAASQFGEKAQGAAEDVRRRVTEASSVARDWAVDQSDVLRDTVQTKPFISIGVSAASAFAAGLVLGVLLTRR